MTTDIMQQGSLNLPKESTSVENVNEYKFEPIKGYPMLNWRGKRPFTATQYYPAQLKEVHGEEVNGWRNKIFWGDSLQVMSHMLRQFRRKVDLIYIDPPFDSKADYKKKIQLQGKTAVSDTGAFEEKQYTDIWSNDDYLQFMYERLVLMRELLSDTGSIYVHCDSHKSHHLRCMMEEIFGPDNFLNEISWCYSDAANSKKYWNTKHDTLLFFKKTNEWTFNYTAVLREHSQENIKKYRYEDDQGKYRLFGKNIAGSPIQWHRDVAPEWEKTNPELVFRHYLKDGSLPLDWWTINPVNQAAKERQGYPTQKPEELLERIILASSNAGDLVFDGFMGSGTTQSVAMKLGRRYVGADINLGAIQTTTKRLIKATQEPIQKQLDNEIPIFSGFEFYNVNNYDIFRNPIQAKELLLEALEVQALDFSSVFDGEKDGRMVKIMPVNRIATRADLAELTAGFDYKAWERKQNDKPNQPVERLLLVCMGHEPNLKVELELAAKPFKIDVKVVDILRDKTNLEFKRDSEALVTIINGELIIDRFYPMNLLQKLSLQKEAVSDWREMVESVMIDWNYDGAVLQPSIVDIPGKDALVTGRYKIPADAGTIRVKITDVLSESWEGGVGGN